MKLDLILAVGCVTSGVIFHFFYPLLSTLILDVIRNRRSINLTIWRVYIERANGLIVLGILPLIVFVLFGKHNQKIFGLATLGRGSVWFIVSVLAMVVLVINRFNAPKATNLARYPQIKIEHWPFSVLVSSALTWLVYLCAYEFLLRGIFLFSSRAVMGQTAAIVLNVFVYVLIHIPKGNKELLASIPFGIILCLIALGSSSVWPAIALHVVLALSNEWFSIYYHPKISVKWK